MKESVLQKTICEMLTYYEGAGFLMWDRLNSGSVITFYGGKRYKIKLCKPGTSDLYVAVGGIFHFVELKSATGKLQPEQKVFKAKCTRHGFEYIKVDTYEDMKALVDGWIKTASTP